MEGFRRYHNQTCVTAVQINLDTPGLHYRKWGGDQVAHAGDWLVCRAGDTTYTVEKRSFAATYEMVSPGVYRKTTLIWAKVAIEEGSISTKEGTEIYLKGDYICYNDATGQDGYSVSKDIFEKIYKLA